MSNNRTECDKRLTNLYNESHEWLLKVSYNICKNHSHASDLVSDLYLYLSKECREKIWWGESYNLIYCQKFLQHRWLNRAPKLNRYKWGDDGINEDSVWIEYDYERDERIMEAHQSVLDELQKLKKTKHFAQAMLYELYWCSNDTLDDVAKKIGLSKSTVFLAIKKIRLHLKREIKNPFGEI